jgi:hypothetical protein
MGNVRQTTLILGEGITEFFFLNSLKDDYSELKSVKPDYPKNTNLEELEIEIEKAIRDFDRVFCIIDMDNKQEGKEKQRYIDLKMKYHNKRFVDEKKGVNCLVRFYETDRCTELFFLYYFCYTTKKFPSYDVLEKKLNTYCEYEKAIKFFKSHPLHPYFKKKGGSLDTAIKNAKKSLKYKNDSGSDSSFSELGEMFDELINNQGK